jgi:hypothetical protein
MMETADQETFATCPDCECRAYSTDIVPCSVCGKDCCKDCLTICGCGCDNWVHRDCSAVWERTKFAEYRWRKACLIDHAQQLEADARESLSEAARARELAGGLK